MLSSDQYISNKYKLISLDVAGMVQVSEHIFCFISGVVILTFFANKNRLNKLSAVDQFIMVLIDFSFSAWIACFFAQITMFWSHWS